MDPGHFDKSTHLHILRLVGLFFGNIKNIDVNVFLKAFSCTYANFFLLIYIYTYNMIDNV